MYRAWTSGAFGFLFFGVASAGAQTDSFLRHVLRTESTTDQFGTSVGVSGSIAIIGASGDNHAGFATGAAYLFDALGGGQLARLVAGDAQANDWFGASVAIDGDFALVGARRDNNNDRVDAGAAYVFDVNTGSERYKLSASDGAAFDELGVSVAISGHIALVGAPFHDERGADAGAAYLFDLNTGQEINKLTAFDGLAGDQFGWSLAIDGDLAIIGARGHDGAAVDAGAAYVFDITTGDSLGRLTASDASMNDGFGTSVALSNGLALVGSPHHDGTRPGAGAAYLFDTVNDLELGKILPVTEYPSIEFGSAVALDDKYGVISAPKTSHWSDFALFVTQLMELDEFTELVPLEYRYPQEGFGAALAMEGDVVVAGTPADLRAGSVHILVVPEPTSISLLGLGALLAFRRRHGASSCMARRD